MKKSFGYVDGFILPVPKKNIATYKKWAKLAGKVWLEHGAIDYVECMAEDVPAGKITSFSKSVKLKKGEVVFFSWATYKSKADRNRVMKKVMSDPRLTSMNEDNMPFDGMRMFWGGFKPVIKF
jgi:uncharacterized protein YbaA (DUF1428 family)